MFFLTLKGKPKEGAFAILNTDGEKILLFFQEKDDAERYKLLLEEEDYPEMEIIEYDDELIKKTIQLTGYNYTIITPHDLVVPPDTFN
jgi:hypothetical protein